MSNEETLSHDPRVLAARVCELFAAALTVQGWALVWATDLALRGATLDLRLLGVEAMAAGGASSEDLVEACQAFRLAVAVESGWDLDEYRSTACIFAVLPALVEGFGELPLGCWGDRLDLARCVPSGRRAARAFARSTVGSDATRGHLALELAA